MVRTVATKVVLCWVSVVLVCLSVPLFGQLVDKNKAPNADVSRVLWKMKMA